LIQQIFIRYELKDQALVALRALAGRKFSDRTVVATFIDEDDYLTDNF
jgi:splicing factor U2AF subunit